MDKLAPAFTALALVVGCSVDGDVGVRQQDIVRGTVSEDGAWPAVVTLGGCTGTLISPRVVLTARHCGTPSAAGFGNRSDSSSDWISVIDREGHPSTDIALLTIAEPGPTAPVPIGRVALSAEHVGQEVIIVGFGQTGEYNSDSGIKREGVTRIYSFDGEEITVGESPTAHTCYGDSGGPYFTEWDGVLTVFATTSYGTALCETGLAVGMRVDVVQDWIDAYVAEHDPPQCEADGRCAADCPELDIDCCDAADGACSDACGPELDPDCRDCGADGWCVADCASIDPDCCDGADGVCDDACGPELDADCAGDDPPGGDDPPDDGDPPGGAGDGDIVSGGCATAGDGGGATGVALLFAMCALLRRRRSR
jgi:uncharacterized protein (TIGR03382 family)